MLQLLIDVKLYLSNKAITSEQQQLIQSHLYVMNL